MWSTTIIVLFFITWIYCCCYAGSACNYCTFSHINMFFWNAPPYGLFNIFDCSASHAKHTEILFFQPVWFLCTPDFSSQRYTPTHFFSGNLVSTPEKLLFLKKIYPPPLTCTFGKSYMTLFPGLFHKIYLIYTFNAMSIKRTTHSFQTMSGSLSNLLPLPEVPNLRISWPPHKPCQGQGLYLAR